MFDFELCSINWKELDFLIEKQGSMPTHSLLPIEDDNDHSTALMLQHDSSSIEKSADRPTAARSAWSGKTAPPCENENDHKSGKTAPTATTTEGVSVESGSSLPAAFSKTGAENLTNAEFEKAPSATYEPVGDTSGTTA